MQKTGPQIGSECLKETFMVQSRKHFPALGLTLATLIVVGVGGLALQNLSALMTGSQRVQHSLEVLEEFETMLVLMVDAETGQRGYVITGDEVFLDPYAAAVASDGIAAHIQRLRQMTLDNPSHQQQLDSLEPLIVERLMRLHQTIEVRRAQGFEAARQLVASGEGKLVMDEIRQTLVEMRAEEDQWLRSRTSVEAASARHTINAVLLGAILAGVMVIVSIVMLSRENTQRQRAEQALRELNAQLEERVQQRTLELQAANRALQAELAERQRVTEALSESELRLRTTMDSMLEGAQLIGSDWRYLYVNDAVAAQGRQPKAALLGQTMMAMYPGIEHTALFARLQACMEQRVAHAMENEFTFPDGSTGWFELNIQPVPEGLFILSRDVTRSKRAEQEIQQQLKRLRALREIDLSIIGSTDVSLSLQVVLEQVMSQLRVDAADILLLRPQTNLLEYAAGRGFRSKIIASTQLRLGQGHTGYAALERRVQHVADLTASDMRFGRTALVAAEGFVEYYGAPLIAKGQVVGVLEVFHRQRIVTDPNWLEFLEALGGQAAIAIDNAQLFDSLQRSNAELVVAYETTLEGWSNALDLRDKETEGHTLRVTEMTERLARALGIGAAELMHIRRGALLHDIGKMGIPDGILLKPGKLTEAEWAVMKKHPVYAYQLLAPITYLREALDIPYAHHEKWDGTGYPRGLKGEDIPLAARLFAVVDVWDALRSDRPYRPGWPDEKVQDYIRALSRVQFDPQVVEVFLDVINHRPHLSISQ